MLDKHIYFTAMSALTKPMKTVSKCRKESSGGFQPMRDIHPKEFLAAEEHKKNDVEMKLQGRSAYTAKFTSTSPNAVLTAA